MQNKCVRFCLQLDSRTHIGPEEFKLMNWLPAGNRFQQCVVSKAFKFFQKSCPSYAYEIFHEKSNFQRTRRSHLNLVQPNRRTNFGQAALSYIGPSLWNILPNEIKDSVSLNTFKHKVKYFYLNNFINSENDIYNF